VKLVKKERSEPSLFLIPPRSTFRGGIIIWDVYMQDNKTVGAIAKELMEKDQDKYDLVEMQRAMQEDWNKNIRLALEDGKKNFERNFYIVIETKRERIMENVIRNYFLTRESCPSPNYDQTVFRYLSKEEMLEFLWVLPCKDACLNMKDHALEIDKEERDLLHFVLDFYDGVLEKRAMLLNNEIDLTIH
jgi:hypothetical protein